MNTIREIRALNKRELESGTSIEGSWHNDYRDTAWIYIGGLPFDLSEGDVVTIFSQFGEPAHVNLVRDKETGKSKGFAFLKYEDQRSTDLAVDNLGGAAVLGRVLKVDHTRYKRKDDEPDEDNIATQGIGRQRSESESEGERRRRKRRATESVGDKEAARPLLREERELAALIRDHDEEDPMKEYLVKEKQEEVDAALKKYEKRASKRKGDDRKHRRRHHHRSRRDSPGSPRQRASRASHDHSN